MWFHVFAHGRGVEQPHIQPSYSFANRGDSICTTRVITLGKKTPHKHDSTTIYCHLSDADKNIVCGRGGILQGFKARIHILQTCQAPITPPLSDMAQGLLKVDERTPYCLIPSHPCRIFGLYHIDESRPLNQIHAVKISTKAGNGQLELTTTRREILSTSCPQFVSTTARRVFQIWRWRRPEYHPCCMFHTAGIYSVLTKN